MSHVRFGAAGSALVVLVAAGCGGGSLQGGSDARPDLAVDAGVDVATITDAPNVTDSLPEVGPPLRGRQSYIVFSTFKRTTDGGTTSPPPPSGHSFTLVVNPEARVGV